MDQCRARYSVRAAIVAFTASVSVGWFPPASPPKHATPDGPWQHDRKLPPVHMPILIKHMAALRNVSLQMRAEVMDIKTARDITVIVFRVKIARRGNAGADGDASHQHPFGGGLPDGCSVYDNIFRLKSGVLIRQRQFANVVSRRRIFFVDRKGISNDVKASAEVPKG